MKKIISLASLFFLFVLTLFSGQSFHVAAAANDAPVITGVSITTVDSNNQTKVYNASLNGTDFSFDLVGVPGDQVIKKVEFNSPTATRVSFVPYDDPNYSEDTDLQFVNGVATLDRTKFDAWYQRVITSDPTLSSQIDLTQIDTTMFDQLFTVQGFRDMFTGTETNPMPLYLKDTTGNESQYGLKFVVEGWKTVNGKKYYIGEDGLKYTGWHDDIDTHTYYFDPRNGDAAAVGWDKIDGDWYYFNSNGAMVTGWVKYNNKYYFLDKNTGSMHTGWVLDGGKWFYLNASGAKVTGWVYVNKSWYYINSYGVMQTGWVKDGKYSYYLKTNGAMATGWVSVSGKWYYLNSKGVMATGWVKVSGKWYYLYSDGHMAANTFIGKHKIGKNGVMVY